MRRYPVGRCVSGLVDMLWRVGMVLLLTGILPAGKQATGAGVTSSFALDIAEPISVPIPPEIMRIYFASADELSFLASELDIWEAHHEAGYVVARLMPGQRSQLTARGYRLEDDLATGLEAAAAQSQVEQARVQAPEAAGIPGYACYRTVEETYAALATLAMAHPELAAWTDIGDSWEKMTPGGNTGYDIYTLVLTNRAIPGPKPKFFLMAATHAREYATAELATRFAERLVRDYGTDPDVTWLLDQYELHVAPQTNPDGRKQAEMGWYWRKNTDNDDGCAPSWGWGVDLNRNYDFKWNTIGSSDDACNELYHGPGAATEPEVQAIQNYLTASFPDQRGPADADAASADAEGLLVSLHSYGELILFPWAWTTAPAPNMSQLQTLARRFGYLNGYQACDWNWCLYPGSGSTDDWAYGVLGLASYTFELGTTFFQSCASFESDILPRNQLALMAAFKSARRPYLDPSGPLVQNVSVSLDHMPAGGMTNLTAVINDSSFDSNGYGTEPVQNIRAARYSVDVPSWRGGAPHVLSATDGAFDSSIEPVTAVVDTAGWSAGRHLLFVEGQDVAGNWGVPTAVFLEIIGEATATPTPTATSSVTPTPTPTATSSATPTPLPTGALSVTPTATHPFTPTATVVLSSTPTVTATDQVTLTVTVTPSLTPTGTATNQLTPTATATPSPTPTATATQSPTPTATWSPTPTITPTPTTPAAVCSERVNNGGFEQADGWAFAATATQGGYTTIQAHLGVRSARLGLLPIATDLRSAPGAATWMLWRNLPGEDAPLGGSYSTVYQTVTLPATALTATLSFWYRPGTQAVTGDFQRVLLLNTDYTYRATLLSVLANADTWRQASFDLTAYRGQTLVLYFEVYNDDMSAGPRTWLFLDDISLIGCAPGAIPITTPTSPPIAGQLRAWLPLLMIKAP